MKIKRAFTLIELLVVIAIIALLAAILFPVFATVRSKARQSTCASNMKQIGLALAQYSSDYDECYPCAEMQTGIYWNMVIYPYVKNGGVYICPENFNSGFTPVVAAGGYPAIHVSYFANASGYYFPGTSNAQLAEYYTFAPFSMVQRFTPFTQPPGVSLATIVNPTNCISVSEALDTFSSYSYFFDISYPEGPYQTSRLCGINGSPNGASSCMFAGHSGMSNYLFADGHVKSLAPFGTVNSWFTDNTPLANHLSASGVTNAQTNLTYAYGMPGTI